VDIDEYLRRKTTGMGYASPFQSAVGSIPSKSQEQGGRSKRMPDPLPECKNANGGESRLN
jgi:hypothetical protein